MSIVCGVDYQRYVLKRSLIVVPHVYVKTDCFAIVCSIISANLETRHLFYFCLTEYCSSRMLRTEIVGSGNMYLEDLCTKWYVINTGDRTRSTYQNYLTKPQNTLYKYNRLNVRL